MAIDYTNSPYFEIRVPNYYTHDHERKEFNALCKHVSKWANLNQRYCCLVADPCVDTKELDALLLTDFCIYVLEFKNYKGNLTIGQQMWTLETEKGETIEVKGGADGKTPFQQVNVNRRAFHKHLEKHNEDFKGLFNSDPESFKEFTSKLTRGVVVFNGNTNIDKNGLAVYRANNAWFNVVNVEQFTDYLNEELIRVKHTKFCDSPILQSISDSLELGYSMKLTSVLDMARSALERNDPGQALDIMKGHDEMDSEYRILTMQCLWKLGYEHYRKVYNNPHRQPEKEKEYGTRFRNLIMEAATPEQPTLVRAWGTYYLALCYYMGIFGFPLDDKKYEKLMAEALDLSEYSITDHLNMMGYAKSISFTQNEEGTRTKIVQTRGYKMVYMGMLLTGLCVTLWSLLSRNPSLPIYFGLIWIGLIPMIFLGKTRWMDNLPVWMGKYSQNDFLSYCAYDYSMKPVKTRFLSMTRVLVGAVGLAFTYFVGFRLMKYLSGMDFFAYLNDSIFELIKLRIFSVWVSLYNLIAIVNTLVFILIPLSRIYQFDEQDIVMARIMRLFKSQIVGIGVVGKEFLGFYLNSLLSAVGFSLKLSLLIGLLVWIAPGIYSFLAG